MLAWAVLTRAFAVPVRLNVAFAEPDAFAELLNEKALPEPEPELADFDEALALPSLFEELDDFAPPPVDALTLQPPSANAHAAVPRRMPLVINFISSLPFLNFQTPTRNPTIVARDLPNPASRYNSALGPLHMGPRSEPSGGFRGGDAPKTASFRPWSSRISTQAQSGLM